MMAFMANCSLHIRHSPTHAYSFFFFNNTDQNFCLPSVGFHSNGCVSGVAVSSCFQILTIDVSVFQYTLSTTGTTYWSYQPLHKSISGQFCHKSKQRYHFLRLANPVELWYRVIGICDLISNPRNSLSRCHLELC